MLINSVRVIFTFLSPFFYSFNPSFIGVEGHIKTKFYKPEAKFNTEVGGIGCITDGQYKITITISNYTGLDFDKGVRVRVIGTVDASGM